MAPNTFQEKVGVMPAWQGICDQRRSHRFRLLAIPHKRTASYREGHAAGLAKLSISEQTLRRLSVYRECQAEAWRPEEVACIRVYEVAAILHLIIVGLVITQTFLFMF